MSFMGGKNLRRNYGKTRAAVASVATERFQILLDQAKKMAWTDERLSRRYVTLARKISSRTKVRIPRESKMYLCKGCGLALVPGHNAKKNSSKYEDPLVCPQPSKFQQTN